MKLKITLAFVLLLFAFSCKKDANGGGDIIGKWRSIEAYYPPGGPLLQGSAHTTTSEYIQFNWPSGVQSTVFSNCTGYSVKGNNLILKFSSDPNQINYTYTIKRDTLTLYPENCGGCTMPFVKE